ncbi:MAG: AMP-binding protein [Bacillota bacterium]|nr:AMP-binding protein [Bacillota bacterium]
MPVLPDWIRRQARERGEKVFLIYHDEPITFHQYDELTDRLAYLLAEQGVRPGDHVAIAMGNSPEILVSLGAVAKRGAVATPLNPSLTERELRFLLEDVEAKLLLAHRPVGERVLDEHRRRPFRALEKVIVWDRDREGAPEGALDAHRAMRRPLPPTPLPSLSDDDVMMILYTSGTTGTPKGAMLTHGAMLGVVRVLAQVLGMSSEETVVNTLPYFHVFAISVEFLQFLYLGGTIVVRDQFHPRGVAEDIARYRATFMDGVPSMYILLNQLLHSESGEHLDLSSLRVGVVGAAPVPVEVQRAFEEKTGIVVVEGYGQTEVSPIASLQPPDPEKRRYGSCGQPLPGTEVKIVGPDGRELPPGEPGELWVRGFNVMRGYWNRPEESRQVLDPDGWLHTGDVLRQDSDGYLYMVDRLKDMIIYSGYNIYPKEVETVLYHHPAVAEAIVVGSSHPTKGEVPIAFVRLKEGVEAAPEELLELCRKELVPYKVPRQVILVEDFPRTPQGKPIREELKKMAAGPGVRAQAAGE